MNLSSFAPSIGSFAEHLALRYFPHGRINPETIARACGLTVLHTSFRDEVDGFLLHEQSRDVIVVNDRRAPRGSDRSRFTIAHELGHHFTRPNATPPQVAARLPGAPNTEERPADHFAAHLLMPALPFRLQHSQLAVGGLTGVARLGRYFGTSLTATAYRALELGLFTAPCAVLLWHTTGQRCGRRLSPATWRLGEAYRPLAATPPAESPSAMAVESLATGLKVGSTPVLEWFIGLDGRDRDHHFALIEEVHSRGSHGWITLLHAA